MWGGVVAAQRFTNWADEVLLLNLPRFVPRREHEFVATREDLTWARQARRHWRPPWPEHWPELDALKGGPLALAGVPGGGAVLAL